MAHPWMHQLEPTAQRWFSTLQGHVKVEEMFTEGQPVESLSLRFGDGDDISLSPHALTQEDRCQFFAQALAMSRESLLRRTLALQRQLDWLIEQLGGPEAVAAPEDPPSPPATLPARATLPSHLETEEL